MVIRRATAVGLILLTGAVSAGCTAAGTGASDGSGAVSASPSGSPTSAAPDSDSDEAVPPIPVDEIADWAGTAVPGSDTDGYVFGFSGWLGEKSSLHGSARFESLEPGRYQAQIACRGDGSITLISAELDESPAAAEVVCADETIAFDLTTGSVGVDFRLALDGAPTVYAVSLVSVD